MAQTQVVQKTSTKIQYPNRYNVIIYNDDYTPMDFVIHVLVEVFNKNIEEAKQLTLAVHNEGNAVAGTYNLEIAEQKTKEAVALTKANGYPLHIAFEEV